MNNRIPKTLLTVLGSAGLACVALSACIAQTSAPVPAPMQPIVTSNAGNTLTTGPIDERLDYTSLYKLDDVDLALARAMHFSDEQVARMVKLSDLSGIDLREVVHRINGGSTFRGLAEEYGVPYASLSDVSAEADRITRYQSARATTGKAGMVRHNVLGDDKASPGSTAVVLEAPTQQAAL